MAKKAIMGKAQTAVTDLKIEMGKVYLNAKDIWALDHTGPWVQVHIRGAIFKVDPAKLVIFDNGNEEVVSE
jgi:hypothetical protein